MMPTAKNALRAAKLFEFTATRLRPVVKLLAGKNIARRCRSCAASEHYLTLGADGICAACHSHTPTRAEATDTDCAREFDDVLRSYAGKGIGPYDALALLSGGKDSCYMISRIREEFPGLRLLAFSIDNSFMSAAALENIAAQVPALGVDHLFLHIRRDFIKRLFGCALQNLNDGGCYGTVDFSDGELILDSARRTASNYGIPLILCGYSRYQVQNGLKLSSFESPAATERRDRTEVSGIPLGTIFTDRADLDMWWKGSAIPLARLPRLLFPLYAWNMPEERVRDTVARLGLIRKGYDSPLVTNHALMPLFGVVDLLKFGYFSFEPELTRMIREGKAKRESWLGAFELLEYCSRSGLFIRAQVEEGFKSLGLRPDDLSIRLWQRSIP